jgi:hypothetical protein
MSRVRVKKVACGEKLFCWLWVYMVLRSNTAKEEDEVQRGICGQ